MCSSEEVVSPQYSGLYAYYIATNTWQLLLPDLHELHAPQPRVSHSMLFHPVCIIQLPSLYVCFLKLNYLNVVILQYCFI